MRVELSSAFEVLAHELRGCTSVIQGYVRLLQQTRGQGAADGALLQKLLDATSRLTTLGKQATDVASWSARDHANGEDAITMTQLLTDASSQHPDATAVLSLPGDVAMSRVSTPSRAALSGAVGAIIFAAARHTVDRTVDITGQAHGTDVTISIAGLGQPPDGTPPTPAALEAFLAQGGQNLALVLASHVLAAHGARLEATADRPPALHLHFSTSRGPQ